MTKLDWDVSTGTTMDEIGFWSRLDARLEEINNQLKNPLIGTRPLFLCASCFLGRVNLLSRNIYILYYSIFR